VGCLSRLAEPMEAAGVTVSRLPDATVLVHIAGRWQLAGGLGSIDAVDRQLSDTPPAGRVAFDASGLLAWDSSLLLVVQRVREQGRVHGVPVDTSGLPDGLRRLLALSDATSGQRPPAPAAAPRWLARLGMRGLASVAAGGRLLTFLGELAFSAARLVTGHARLRKRDLLVEIEAAGARSLPIVAVVGFLLGMILAFVGNVTLRRFGAAIYVANVVTVAMVRELGPVMTSIVMAGRTGSAYAAQLGTMKVTQEVDALTTMALPPTDFLVLPRALALSLMLPLLVVYADFIALAGGALVVLVGGGSISEYLRQARSAIGLSTFAIGVAKSVVFGIIVAVAGCLKGLRADTGAAAVGDAATGAVVTSIVWVIAIDGLFAVVLDILGI
jgi:phospholipid/cholesterol/gamma-HCH transport system permease protein